ncbi:DinB family protein [Chloroflexota bacterium]
MDTVKFIEQCLNESYERLIKSLQGLSPDEMAWRPVPHANCIAEIVWHVARGEDRMVRSRTGLGPELWESQQWYQRFGYPREQPRTNDFQILKILKLPPPKLVDLLSYIDALHKDTLDRLHSLSQDDLDRVPDPSHPERPIASYFRHLVIHTNNHHGQVDYIRGLMQMGWDLLPGTGIVQP